MIGPEPENERRVRPLTWAAVALESEILSILARDAEPGERLEFAFRR